VLVGLLQTHRQQLLVLRVAQPTLVRLALARFRLFLPQQSPLAVVVVLEQNRQQQYWVNLPLRSVVAVVVVRTPSKVVRVVDTVMVDTIEVVVVLGRLPSAFNRLVNTYTLVMVWTGTVAVEALPVRMSLALVTVEPLGDRFTATRTSRRDPTLVVGGQGRCLAHQES
jgi:hypothetical protein